MKSTYREPFPLSTKVGVQCKILICDWTLTRVLGNLIRHHSIHKGAPGPERKFGFEALEASAKLRKSSVDCLSSASFGTARSEQLTPIRNSFDRTG